MIGSCSVCCGGWLAHRLVTSFTTWWVLMGPEFCQFCRSDPRSPVEAVQPEAVEGFGEMPQADGFYRYWWGCFFFSNHTCLLLHGFCSLFQSCMTFMWTASCIGLIGYFHCERLHSFRYMLPLHSISLGTWSLTDRSGKIRLWRKQMRIPVDLLN